jgi:hypothetical protein
MSLTDIAAHAVGRFIGRMARRAAAWICVAIFVLAAIYQATTAISIALELKVGPVYAHLIVAGFYIAAAVIILISLWVAARRTAAALHPHTGAGLESELQLATVFEAMLLGYSLSRRK